MSYINYNEYDIQKMDGYAEILENLGGCEPTDEEVWEEARMSRDMPVFENILYQMTLERIEEKCKERGINVSFYVNAVDTHLYVEEQEVWNWEDFQDAISELEEEECL